MAQACGHHQSSAGGQADRKLSNINGRQVSWVFAIVYYAIRKCFSLVWLINLRVHSPALIAALPSTPMLSLSLAVSGFFRKPLCCVCYLGISVMASLVNYGHFRFCYRCLINWTLICCGRVFVQVCECVCLCLCVCVMAYLWDSCLLSFCCQLHFAGHQNKLT